MKYAFSIDKIWIDVLSLLVVLFGGMWAMDLQTVQLKAVEQSALNTPGNITVQAVWPPGLDVDVDLWVKGPYDHKAVGYSRRADVQSGYLRDDVGQTNDLTDLNYEIAAIRGLKAGRYVVNLHLYDPRSEASVTVKVQALFNREGTHVSNEIAEKEVVLTQRGQEVTAFSFELDEYGALVVGSVSSNFIPLRAAAQP